MSATTVASLFLALFCLRSIAAGQKNVDIVVLKYEGLGYSETVPVKEKYYFFSFCLCSQKTPDPERSASCNCASDVRGKKASDSIPRALFSASCIHNSNPLKCLTTGFKSVQDDRRLLYVKVDIDSRTLTSPSWQVIPNNPQKTSSKITAYTRSGDIRLDYVVFSSKNKEALSQKSVTFKDFLENREYPKALFQKRFNRIKEFERKAKKTSLTWKKNRSGVGNTLHQIKDYLASKSNAQALKPLSADFDLDAFRSMITQSHNRYRSMHRVRPFEYDQTIERSAQQWADHLADQEACLKHDPMRRYGENLFFFGGSMFPPAEAIAESVTKSFYIEGNGYNYNGFRPVEIHRVGHFTQMIWKASERLGVGVAIRKSSGQKSGSCLPNKGLFLIYVVVKYDPPGNVLSRDQFLANILPPAGVQ